MTARVHPNTALVRTVAKRPGPLRERVVFLGGAAAGLLITDPAAEAIRPTDDVDVAIEVASLVEYHVELREQLLALRFSEEIIAIVDGRAERSSEVQAADGDVRLFLAEEAGQLLGSREFQDALPGHLQGDPASQARLSMVVARLEVIAGSWAVSGGGL